MRIYPMDPQGAAENVALVDGPIVLRDVTRTLRFGLKGRGAVAFLEAQGITVPDVNHCADGVLRLGAEDVVIVDGPKDLYQRWQQAEGRKGYNAWRDETWAMMHLSGPRLFDLTAKICPVDLSDQAFKHGQIAQTRVGYVEAIIWRNDRNGSGFDVFFDIAATAFFANGIATASKEFTERPNS